MHHLQPIYYFDRNQSALLQPLMSTRVTINIGFYFQQQHYAQLQAYIPRSEAIKIPELCIESREKYGEHEANEGKGRQAKSESKKQSDDEMLNEEEDINSQNEMELDNEMGDEDNDIENEDENELDQDQDNEVERALEELEQDNYDSEESESEVDQEEDIDMDSLSNQSPIKGYNNTKTKRQKGETKDLVQLPDRRPRKDKKLDEASEIIRREEKERKRKQYLKKQVQAQEKATLQKILNETGRKLRMREQKQLQDEMQRQQKVYKTLGNVPKIVTYYNQEGKFITIHKTTLFPEFMTKTHDIKMRELCTNCGTQSKYTLKNQKYACSLPCYKLINTQ